MRSARELGAPETVAPVLERPRDPAFGEWTTNLAMTLAKPLRRKPQEIATDLIGRMDLHRATVSEAYVAGPGFINFRLDSGTVAAGLRDILAAGAQYGHSNVGQGRDVNIEFVSANPTGPLHVGHGRQAALGDAIASLLEATGWKVSREFYYNDGGVQITNLTLSVVARVRELAGEPLVVPEGGYHGEYIREIAERFVATHGGDAGAVVRCSRTFGDSPLPSFVPSRIATSRRSACASTRTFSNPRCIPRGVSSARCAPSAPRGARTSTRGHCGFARPSSRMTRIASCASA